MRWKLATLLLTCLPAFGAGSVSQSTAPINNSNGFIVTLNWTGDSITGSVPATIIQGAQQLQGQRIVSVETAPLSPAPTNGYSITLTDFSGVDLLTGNGVNQSATTPALLTLPSAQPPLYGSYTLNVTGNAVASAQGRVVIYFAPVSGVVGVLGPLGTLAVSGTTPSGGTNVTSPVKSAAVFNTTQPTVTNGQVVDNQATARGAQIVATGVDTFNTTVNTALPAGANTIGAVLPGLPTPSSQTVTVTSATGTGTVINLTINSAVNSATVEFVASGSVTGGFVQMAPDSFGTSCVNMTTGAVGTSIALASVGVSIYRCDTAGATGIFTAVLTVALTGTGSVAITAKLSGGPAPPIVMSQGSDQNNNNHPLGVVINGSGTAGSVLQVGGSDGVNTHNLLMDTAGRLNTGADTTGSGTLNAVNTTASLVVAGESSASFVLPAGNTLVGTIAAQYSWDGGTTWLFTEFRNNNTVGGWVSTLAVNSTVGTFSILLPGGASNVRVTVTAFTSGTASVTLRGTAQPDGGLPGTVGPPGGPATPFTQSIGVFDQTASGTLGALNNTVSIPLNGLTSASILFNAGNNLVGTILAEYSNDGGTTWTSPTYFRNFGFHVWYSPNSFFSGPLHIQVPGGASNLRVRVSAYTSGSATATLRATAQPEQLPATASGILSSDNSPPPAVAMTVAGNDYVNAPNGTVRAVRVDANGNTATAPGITVFNTYQSTIIDNSIPANPTDIAFLPGNATNRVVVTRIEVSCTATAATNADILIGRRSVLDTGGTTSAFNTNFPLDSNNAAAQSSPLLYTVLPTSITGDGTFDARKIFIPAAGTGAYNAPFIWTPEPMGQPLVLRGAGQNVAINFNGAAIAGLACDIQFQWIETTLI